MSNYWTIATPSGTITTSTSTIYIGGPMTTTTISSSSSPIFGSAIGSGWSPGSSMWAEDYITRKRRKDLVTEIVLDAVFRRHSRAA